MDFSKYKLGAVVAVVVIVILYFLNSGSKEESAVINTSSDIAPVATTDPQAFQGDKVIQASPNGFSPQDFVMRVGNTLTWHNTDTVDHEIRSNPHPEHDKFPQINEIGLLKPGEKKSIKITEPGIYTYHDHLNPTAYALKGSFRVEP